MGHALTAVSAVTAVDTVTSDRPIARPITLSDRPVRALTDTRAIEGSLSRDRVVTAVTAVTAGNMRQVLSGAGMQGGIRVELLSYLQEPPAPAAAHPKPPMPPPPGTPREDGAGPRSRDGGGRRRRLVVT